MMKSRGCAAEVDPETNALALVLPARYQSYLIARCTHRCLRRQRHTAWWMRCTKGEWRRQSDGSLSRVCWHVWIGNAAAARDHALLETLDVTHIVNVTRDPSQLDLEEQATEVEHSFAAAAMHRVAVKDKATDARHLLSLLPGAISFIEQARAVSGRKGTPTTRSPAGEDTGEDKNCIGFKITPKKFRNVTHIRELKQARSTYARNPRATACDTSVKAVQAEAKATPSRTSFPRPRSTTP